MKYIYFTFIFLFFLFPVNVFAQSTTTEEFGDFETESFIDPTTFSYGLDFFPALPADVKILGYGNIGQQENTVLMATGTTILGFTVAVQELDDVYSLTTYCGDQFFDYYNLEGYTTYTLSLTINLHCELDENHLFGMFLDSNVEADVQGLIYYVERDTRIAFEQPSYRDWLFVAIIGLFLLAFLPLGFLYSILRGQKYK